MRIGELAEKTGIGTDTVRYYERLGLLPPPARRPNGYRDYADRHVERLAFIRHCRALDMPLDDIRTLLGFLAQPNADCGAVNRLIDKQLGRLAARIDTLRDLQHQLLALRTECSAQSSAAECGILRRLVEEARDTDHREG
jgi:Cd(II)/Pb(II)-responsive transcriptional regulator